MLARSSALGVSPVRIVVGLAKHPSVRIRDVNDSSRSANSRFTSFPCANHPPLRSATDLVRYLDDLLAENQRLRNAAASAASSDVVSRPSTTTLVEAISSASTTSTIQPETSPSAIQAPSIDDRPWFFDLKIPHTPILIGEASDVAFATRFRQAISDRPHNHIPRVNYATDERLLTLSNVNCPWPSPSRARLLVNVALKYVSRCYHIVRRSLILEGLEQALLSPASCDSLFKAKLWALFAIGEMYSTRMAAEEKNFPGTTYFAKATHVLQVVSERPRIDAIEVRLLLVRTIFAHGWCSSLH